MDFFIRPAVLEDCETIRFLQEQIAALHRQGRPDLFKAEARFYSREAFSEKLRDPNEFIYIAQRDGRTIGYVFARLQAYRDHPTYLDRRAFYVDDLCVDEACRGQGVGRALMDRCRSQAKALRCHDLFLQVYTFNEDAIAFYRHCGLTSCLMRMEQVLEEPAAALPK